MEGETQRQLGKEGWTRSNRRLTTLRRKGAGQKEKIQGKGIGLLRVEFRQVKGSDRWTLVSAKRGPAGGGPKGIKKNRG